MKLIIALSLSLVACAEAGEARLDHAQILAVRAEPPHVAPGQQARIDVLAGDDSGAVFEADPETLVAGELVVEHTAGGWFVTAGAVPGLANLAVTLTIDGLEWRADKALIVGAPGANPRVAAMQVDGSSAATLVAPTGSKPAVTAIGEGGGLLTYAWYSSVGDLQFYRQPTAILDAAEPAEGQLLLVVRDGAGGVGWQVLPARVE
jgi:hypothetical protein